MARYSLRVMVDFAAAHLLRGYPGACSRLHGHNWKVEVEASTTGLDKVGMGIDFKLLKEASREVIRDLDHRLLNDIEPFDKVNPTAENIASHLHGCLAERLNDERVEVTAVTLWESDRACVRYAEDNGR